MSDEYILRIGRISTQFCVKVRTTITQTAIANNLHHSLRQFKIINGELVRIPTILRITTICVNRTQHAIIYCDTKFMLKSMARQCRMVNFNIHLEILIKIVSFQESYYRFRIRSEEHTSELQSRQYLVCRLL